MRSVLEHLPLPPRTSCSVDTAFLSPNATGKLRDIETPARWLPQSWLISLGLPPSHSPQTPSVRDRSRHPGPSNLQQSVPSSLLVLGSQGPGHTSSQSSASGLLASSEHPGPNPGLNLFHTAVGEALPGSLNSGWRGKEGWLGTWEHPCRIPAQGAPSLPVEHSWSPTLPTSVWNAHFSPTQVHLLLEIELLLPLQFCLISHNGSNLSSL